MKRLILAGLSAIFLSACDFWDVRPTADTVFLGGAVYTADDQRSWAEAVVIHAGEIKYVGSNREARKWIGRATNVISLDGKMLMPSFHDAHAHVRYGGTASLGCNLDYEEDVERIRELLADCVATGDYGPNDWVIGGGWPLAAFPDANAPATILDEALQGRPAYFSDAFGHNAWVSTRALELAGIDAYTRDPPQGVIVRDPETGEPSGTLRDAAMALLDDVIPEETDEERYVGLLSGIEQANAFGITAFIEPGATEDSASLYKRLDREGVLNARVLLSMSPIGSLADRFGPEIYDLLGIRNQFRGTYLNVDSVKVYIDGVIETRTSFMLEPYEDGSNFPPFYGQDELNELYTKLDEMGIQIHTHAIGDAAIRSALDAYEFALEANGPNNNRHQIVHLQLIDEEDIPRFGELGVAANFQCMWCYPDVYIDLAIDIVGEERVNRFYPVASIERSGGFLVGGSDWDVSSLNPLDAIETAVRRQDPFENEGRVLGTNEHVDLETAIDMYTRNAAYIMRLEHRSGTIEVGQRADLIVLDRNLFEIPATEINEAQVLLTLMDGRVVYEAE